MLEFLKGKKNHFIGVDFGTSAIKVVELSYKDRRVSLENYGIVDMSLANHEDQQIATKASSYEQRINNSLKKLVEKMKLRDGTASFVSIPGFSGLITIIELPEMQNEELTKAIKFEAHKYIPSSLDEIAMSWEVIRHDDANASINEKLGGKKIKVLLVAAPKRDIERYDRFVSGTKLEVNAIELETFSIVRSLVGNDAGNFLIIDIGSRATNIILVEKGVVIANRNIDAGGNEITDAIGDSMNISRQRAEDFKKGEKDILNSKESPIIVPVLEFISNESKRIMDAQKEKNPNMRIDGVLLSGGTSKMKGLTEYFSNALEMKVMIGNPWHRIVVPNEVAALTNHLGASFTVALGLALRGIEEYEHK